MLRLMYAYSTYFYNPELCFYRFGYKGTQELTNQLF